MARKSPSKSPREAPTRAVGNSESESGDALSDRAWAALALVPNVEKQCPKTKKPPASEKACTEAIEAFMAKYHRIGLDIQHPDVRQARRTVKEAEDQRRV